MIRWLISRILGFRGMTRDEARDWLAILYTVAMSANGVWLTWIIVWGGLDGETAAQRIEILGWALIANFILIALGTFFLQRRTVNMKVETPGGGSVEFENVTPGKDG